MAELFQKDVRTINEHIKNIFAEGELVPESVIRNFRITASDGKNYDTAHYNLDVIISVGYRVKSLRGTQFRIWATNVLRHHLVEGYTLNKKRLMAQEGRIRTLQEAVRLLGNVALLEGVSDEAKALSKS
jgi:Virulence protein